MKKIEILKDTVASGKNVKTGEKLSVPDEISKADATYLCGIKKARDLDKQEKPETNAGDVNRQTVEKETSDDSDKEEKSSGKPSKGKKSKGKDDE